ncbi:MAG TPA: hypothetical protein VL727_06335 [Puia sp.]|nr:hypothetical protein [Puia sp.]
MSQRKDNKSSGRRSSRLAAARWTAAPLGIQLLYYFFAGFYRSTVQSISWSEFERTILARHAADSIEVINNEEAEVYIKKQFADDPYFRKAMHPYGMLSDGPHYSFRLGSVEELQKKLDESEGQLQIGQRARLV